MDPAIAWFQEEQEGPSKRLWLSIWETNQELEMEHQQQQQQITHNTTTSQGFINQPQVPAVITNNTNNFIEGRFLSLQFYEFISIFYSKINQIARFIRMDSLYFDAHFVYSSTADNNQKLKGMTNKNSVNFSTVLMENSNGQQSNQHQHQHQQTTTQSTQPPQQHSQQQHTERSYYNPSRRKAAIYENRASTYNLNRYQNRIIGKHNGCPWRPTGHEYPPGVLG